MAGRGPQTFKKRQKEQQRKERQQEKIAKRLARKDNRTLSPDDEQNSTDETSDDGERPQVDGIAV